MESVCSTGGWRGRGAGAGPSLALLLVVALFFCHGVFGALHLFPATPGGGFPMQEQRPSHAGYPAGGHETEHPPAHQGATQYAAVLLAAFAGAAFGLLLGVRARRPVGETLRRAGCGFVPAAEGPVFVRGPDARAFLQVFGL